MTSPTLLRSLAVLTAVTYAVVLLRIGPPALVGPDDHGYYLQGRMFADRGVASFALESPVQYVGDHFLMGDDGRFRSRYGPGVAIMVAATQRLFGVEASFELGALFAAATAAGLVLLAGGEFGAMWGVAAALLLAASPGFSAQARFGMSNVPVTAAIVWASHFLLTWLKSGGVRIASAAGFLLGAIPLIRLPETLILLPLGTTVLVHVVRGGGKLREFSAMVLAGALPLVVLAAYNWTQFGSVLRSGYALSGEQDAFAFELLFAHLKHYSHQILVSGLGWVPVLSAAGWLIAIQNKELRVRALLFATMSICIILMYASRQFVPTPIAGQSTRFLLPAFPFLIWLAVIPFSVILRKRKPILQWAAAAALVVLHAAWLARPMQEQMELIAGARRTHHALAKIVQQHVAPGDVLAAPSEALQNLDTYGLWRTAIRDVTVLRTDTIRMSPSKQRTMEVERRAVFEGLDVAARDSIFLESMREWAGGRSVYVVLPGADLEDPSSAWFCASSFDVVDSIRLGDGWKPSRRLPYRGRSDAHIHPSGFVRSPEACKSNASAAFRARYMYLLRVPARDSRRSE